MNLPKIGVFAVLAVLLGAGSVEARNPCVVDAKEEYKECKATCKENVQIAKDACSNRDHDCVEVCRAKRADCREATGVDAAVDACNARLASDRQACKDAFPVGTPERDQCIDQVQVIAFQCRDDARDAARPAIRQCRRDFRTCARACAPADPPISSLDVRACKYDAKQTYVTCKADCREDFQVAKDACRNRDHACVEQCRADRASCRQPFLDQRASDVASCNGTRDAAIQNCKDLYAPDTPARDQCIDNAQVDGFRCRDQARENVRPGLQTCRQDFHGCIQVCPPAS